MKNGFQLSVVLLLAMSAVGAASAPAAAWPPPGDFVVAGDLQHSVLVSTADLVAHLNALPIPARTVTVTFIAGTTPEQHTFTGVLLYDLLNFLGPTFDASVKNDRLRFYVIATGSDGYEAIVSWGEIDPLFENKSVLLAVTQDGISLGPQGPRLVVPGDSRGGRYVSNVVSIRLGRVPDDPVIQFLPLGP